MNFIHIIGRLGKDPESRFTSNGQKVTSFNVAVSVFKAGKEETNWYRVSVFGDRWDKMISYLKKGKPVMVGGELNKATVYTDSSGANHVSLEIVADYIKFVPMGQKDENDQNSSGGSQQSFKAQKPVAVSHVEQGAGLESETEDDMPF